MAASIAREPSAPPAMKSAVAPTPRPSNEPTPVPIAPGPRETPPEAAISLDKTEAQGDSARPDVAASEQRRTGAKKFKIGFWILGISEVILILEGFIPAGSYYSHVGLMYGAGFLFLFAVQVAFVVIYCGFLARKRRDRLLWLALVFSVLGMVANNVNWLALEWHLTYAELGFLSMVRGFFVSSGLPLSCLCNPFVRYFGGRIFYLAVIVNIDCVVKIAFLIWALRKYHDNPPLSLPSA